MFHGTCFTSVHQSFWISLCQLSKLACIPCTLLIQKILYDAKVSKWIKIALVPINFGVAYATVNDVDVNLVGFGE
jgi:hypothetical protein